MARQDALAAELFGAPPPTSSGCWAASSPGSCGRARSTRCSWRPSRRPRRSRRGRAPRRDARRQHGRGGRGGVRGRGALAAFRLVVGRPVLPMLAQSAPDVDAAWPASADGARGRVDSKLDGIRIQVHREGDDVRVFTRSLDDITARVPEIVESARALPARASCSTARRSPSARTAAPGRSRRRAPHRDRTPRSPRDHAPSSSTRSTSTVPTCSTPRCCAASTRSTRSWRGRPGAPAGHRGRREAPTPSPVVGAGQEGVVIKAADAPYEAGRRGAAWIKVKPRTPSTSSCSRSSGAPGAGRGRCPTSTSGRATRDGFVMLGKTFKGMTDEMLAWQTERFTELATSPATRLGGDVRPEQVVEIAFDGLQRSTRYPGGVALRFARVLRYRDDKTAAEADTIESVCRRTCRACSPRQECRCAESGAPR